MLLGTKARKFPGTASLGSVTEVSCMAEPRASEQAQDQRGVHLLHHTSCWAKTTFSLFLHGANGFQGKTPSKASTQHGKGLENTPASQILGVTGSVEQSQTCHHHLQILFSSLLHIPTIIVLLPSATPGIPWQGRTSALSSALSECTHGFTSLSAVRVTGDTFISMPCLLTHYKPSSLLIISLPWAAAGTVC